MPEDERMEAVNQLRQQIQTTEAAAVQHFIEKRLAAFPPSHHLRLVVGRNLSPARIETTYEIVRVSQLAFEPAGEPSESGSKTMLTFDDDPKRVELRVHEAQLDRFIGALRSCEVLRAYPDEDWRAAGATDAQWRRGGLHDFHGMVVSVQRDGSSKIIVTIEGQRVPA